MVTIHKGGPPLTLYSLLNQIIVFIVSLLESTAALPVLKSKHRFSDMHICLLDSAVVHRFYSPAGFSASFTEAVQK